jgi:hypothetical protein
VATLISASALIVFFLGILSGLALPHETPIERTKNPWILWVAIGLIPYLLFMQMLAGLNSYSAAWHVLMPRTFVLIAVFLFGYFASQNWLKNTKKVPLLLQSGSSSFLFALSLAALSLVCLNGAAQMSENWESGPLPIQPVKQGIGAVSLMTDIDDAGTLSCYLELEPYLLDRKSSLE